MLIRRGCAIILRICAGVRRPVHASRVLGGWQTARALNQAPLALDQAPPALDHVPAGLHQLPVALPQHPLALSLRLCTGRKVIYTGRKILVSVWKIPPGSGPASCARVQATCALIREAVRQS